MKLSFKRKCYAAVRGTVGTWIIVCGASARHELPGTSQPGETRQLDGDDSRYPCQPDPS